MGFKTPITIAEVLDGIQSNGYVLPAIQREFVWKADQIEKLLDSLMRGYPIGSFLFWEVDPDNLDEFQFYQFMDFYHQRDHKHNQPINLVGRPQNVIAVLDGQQRLTALNIGLRGWYAEKLPYYRWESDWAFPKRQLYLNLLHPAEDDMEFKYEFKMLREKDLESSDEDKFWFRVADVLRFEDYHATVDYCIDRGLTSKGQKFPSHTLGELWQVVHEKPVIQYFLEEEQDLDKVLNIFIRVNSGGTILSYSDMLLSIATAQWQEKDARQEIHGLVDRLNDVGEGFDFNKDFVLKASLVLSDIPTIEFKVNSFNRQNMLAIEKQWDYIARALHLTANLLASWGYTRQTLVSNNAVIPLAYYLYKNGSPLNFVQSQQYGSDRQAMRHWLMIALLKRTFSGQPDNVLRRIRGVMDQNQDGFPNEAIYEALKPTTKAMAFGEAELEGLLGYQYNQKYTFTVLALLYPWLRFDQRFHKDHIFPRSLFNKTQLAKRGIPPEKWHRWLDSVDDVANLQLLQGIPNQEKSDMEPEAWLRGRYPTSEERAAYRERHLIPDMELRLENFPEFKEARERLIMERLSELLEVERGSFPEK